MSDRVLTLVTLSALVIVVAVVGMLGSAILRVTVVGMLIYLILVIGLYVFVGNSGVFSFGHIAFMAIGAYTVGILRIPAETKQVLFPSLPMIQIPSLAATLAGGFVAAVVALVLGLPLMRLTGLAAGLGTFALLSIAYVVGSNLDPVTGGSTGMAGVPATTTLGSTLVWALALLALAWAFQQTSCCLQLRATREDEVAARALGIGIMKERTISFALSAFITGVGGGLFAQYFGTFNPEAFYLKITFLVVSMLVVGGRASLSGAVVGTFFIAWIAEGLRQIEKGLAIGALETPSIPGLQEVGIALVMLSVLIVMPRGLTRGEELSPRRLAARIHPLFRR
jgi:branched-chain amino acid transport system permease protein